MSILLEGIEMPKEDEEIIIRINSSGTVMTEYALPISEAKAIPVYPHGRLIDADALIDYCKHFAEVFKNSSLPIDKARRDELLGVIGEIVNTPTVIKEEVYGQYTDTAGNYHCIGTKSGEHTIKV